MNRPPFTVAQAAQALAVNEKTIRRMIKRGTLVEGARDDAGRILITVASVEAAARTAGRELAPQATQTAQDNEPAATTIAPALDWAASLRYETDRAVLLARRVGELEEQVKHLTAERDELKAKVNLLDAPPTPAAVHPPVQVSRQPKPRLFVRLLRRVLGHRVDT